MYEVTVDRLKLHDGLNPTSTASKHEVQKPIQELFQERMPEVARLRAQAVAIHPRDNNLYAIACSDGSILIKCFHIESQHQTLISGTCRSSSSSDDHADADVTIQSPAHIIFAPHGGHLIVIKPCGSLNVTGQLRTATGAPSLMLCYVVPPTALTPGAAKPEHYDTCRDSYPDTEAGFVAYEKALRSCAATGLDQRSAAYLHFLDAPPNSDLVLMWLVGRRKSRTTPKRMNFHSG